MANSESPFPSRKTLDHRGPISLNVADAVYFITIAAAERGGSALLDNAEAILDSARHLQASGTWFLHLLLIMPDHLHMLVHIRNADERPSALESTLSNWKHYLSRTAHVEFQRGFFDTRIRDAAHFAEKWDYICRNPVTRGFVESPRAWPHSIAFDPATGCERSVGRAASPFAAGIQRKSYFGRVETRRVLCCEGEERAPGSGDAGIGGQGLTALPVWVRGVSGAAAKGLAALPMFPTC